MILKIAGIAITIFIFLFGTLITYGKVQEKVTNTEKVVEEVKEKVEKTEDKIAEEKEINIEQTVTLKYIQETLQKLNSKIDRETNAIVPYVTAP